MKWNEPVAIAPGSIMRDFGVGVRLQGKDYARTFLMQNCEELLAKIGSVFACVRKKVLYPMPRDSVMCFTMYHCFTPNEHLLFLRSVGDHATSRSGATSDTTWDGCSSVFVQSS